MKASELMIGDWVLYCGIPHRIIAIEADGMVKITTPEKEEEYRRVTWPNRLDPVPLTLEILAKNGFDVLSHENPAAFAYKKEDVSIVEVYWNGPERGYRCIFSYGDTRLRITCHFVHELQHALRLCGIEKEIEL